MNRYPTIPASRLPWRRSPRGLPAFYRQRDALAMLLLRAASLLVNMAREIAPWLKP
ncbi:MULTISPECIES: hypothetical protein [Methylosinus]|uniref:hypothetical protein n=1 Tax=Methylosinus TaxID=425 RepID=UPI0001D2DF73|nr:MULTISPECIES: hypothetical protein [Methylosinus]